MLRILICAYMGAARLAELAWSRQNLDASSPAREGEWSRRTYAGIVAVHTLAILSTALFGRGGGRRPILLLLALAQVLRIWVLRTLGRRWNTRGAVPAGLEIETGGPYRWIRHPNYGVVIVELAALPAAFRLHRLALAVTLVNGLLLAIRIRDEERLLEEHPEWSAHFGPLNRFIPHVF